MKVTGIVRKVDDLGRVVLPVELRRNLDIAEKDPLEIFVEEDKIILRKYQPDTNCCIFCGEPSDLPKFYEKNICRTCATALSTNS